jgi:hypothetical protein
VPKDKATDSLQGDARAYLRALGKLPKDSLVDLARTMGELEKRLALSGPQDDDQLHAWIVDELGVNIPRVAVCEGHVAPFTFLADLYFGRTTSAVAMANRGGAKTFLVAVLHYLNSRFKPGIESCSVGAIEMQARRAYMHLQKLLDKAGKDEISSTTMIDTRWKNGSRVEVLPGTVSAVNGPHPCVVHVDEVELMDPVVFDESRNMSQSTTINGQTYPSQDIITSTRKRGHGPMQKILDAIAEAEIAGVRPPYKQYTWCVFEVAQNVPNCEAAGKGGDSPCPCKDVPNGRWPDGKVRTLKDVCGGRFSHSDGFVPLDDIINTFTKATPEIWEAQQECSRPSSEGLVVPSFSRLRNGVKNWDPDPALGPIFMAVDFGGTNPHAAEWCQLLRYEVEVDWNREKKRIPEGAVVWFDEIYRAEIGNIKLAELIVERERKWRMKHKKFRTFARFGDPQAKAARLDFAHHNPPLKMSWYVTREIEEHVKLVNDWVGNDRMFVDVERCPMFVEEIEAWHYDYKNPDKLVDEFNHAMSALRYGLANVIAMERKRRLGARRPGPTVKKRPQMTVNMPTIGVSRSGPPQEGWRAGLGTPVTR